MQVEKRLARRQKKDEESDAADESSDSGEEADAVHEAKKTRAAALLSKVAPRGLGFAFGELRTFEIFDGPKVRHVTSDDPEQLLWWFGSLCKLQSSQLLCKVLWHVVWNDVRRF